MKKKKDPVLARKHPPAFTPGSYTYTSLDAPQLALDMAALEKDIGIFAARYRHKIADLSAPRLRRAIDMYEDIQSRLHRIEVDCDLREAVSSADPARIAALREWDFKMDAKTGFFEGQIGDIEKTRFARLVRDDALKPYAAWLKHQRAAQHHMLEEKDEKEHRTGYARDVQALRREYRELTDHMRVRTLGRSMAFERAEGMLAMAARTDEEKAKIAGDLEGTLHRKARRATGIYNALMGDTLYWMKARKYRQPEDLDGHDLPPKVMALMTTIVGGQSKRLMQKAGAIRETGEAAEYHHEGYNWPAEAGHLLRIARRFSPDMAKFARVMLKEGHVDARPRRGKALEDEFMRAAAPGTAPYVVVNAARRQPDEMVHVDVHELLGHGYDAWRAQQKQGYLQWRSAPAVEETKAFVMEMFGYGVLVRGEKDRDWKRHLKSEWIDRMLVNGPQQLACHAFEKAAHDMRRKKGPLRTRQLTRLWAKTQKQYGMDEQWPHNRRYGWMMDSHFTETPFRAAAYAFALVAAVNFYDLYEQAEARGEGARRKFIRDYRRAFIDTGGSKPNLHALFKPFGLDPMQPAFFKNAVNWIEKRIDALVAENPAPAAPKGPGL